MSEHRIASIRVHIAEISRAIDTPIMADESVFDPREALIPQITA